MVFSSSFDSVDPPVKSGFDGCVGWSGVVGSGRGDEELLEGLERFVGIVETEGMLHFVVDFVIENEVGNEKTC